MTHSLILFTGFLTAFLLFCGLYLVVSAPRRELEDRLTKITKKEVGEFQPQEKEKRELNLKNLFHQTSKVFIKMSLTKRAEGELAKAALLLKGEEFILINLLAAILPAFLLYLLTGNLGLGVVVGIGGLVAPWIFLNKAKQKRVQHFNNQIGDALTIMSSSLRAGFSFLQAMELVSKEMPAPIGEEFARALLEMNLGTSTEEALQKMTQRIESDDLDLIVTAVTIQRQVGGNLSEVLDNISHTIRERIRIKGEIKTLTAQGKMSGIVIGLLPLGICAFLFIVNPEYMKPLFTSTMGLAILISGFVSQFIGVMIIKKIIAIEV